MTKKVRTNITLMLAKNCELSDISKLIENYNCKNIVYPGNGQITDNTNCVIYKRKGSLKIPEWVDKLRKTINIDISSNIDKTLSQGASIFIPIKHKNDNYIFIINYSIGHFSINKEFIDKYFGIYIAHKELASGRAKIKRGKSREISSNPINKDRMFGRATDEDGFNIILEDNEIIREVTAYAQKEGFYYSMVGNYSSLNISLTFNLDNTDDYISLEKLKTSLTKLIDVYDSVTDEDKKKLFKGLAPVDISQKMKCVISESLKSNLQNFFFFEPETDINLAAIDHFKIGDIENCVNLDIEEYAKGREITYEMLSLDYVTIYDSEGNELKKWHLLDCLYGEFEYDNTVYFISNGELFDINKDKYSDVNEVISSLIDETFSIDQKSVDNVNAEIQKKLDARSSDKEKIRKEYCYNKELSSFLNAELFDDADKHITIYDTQIEVCDVFCPEHKTFIHSKIRRGPDSLSHLFAQGLVSAEAYSKSTNRFVDAVNSKIIDSSKHITEKWQDTLIRYVILSSSKTQNNLPFFAKMHLNSIVRNLISKGFKVKLSWENRINV